MKLNKNKLLVISCYFGDRQKKLYKAPLHYNCYFFSNNKNLQQEAEENKWIFFYIDFILSSDYIVSSCQSKYIKFLKFLDDFAKFKMYNSILYFDDKVYIKEEHIDILIDISNQSDKYNIIIRKHENNKNTIMSEVEEAKHQERYARNMDKTLKLINQKINNNEIKNDVEICNTGLIMYINHNQYNELKFMLNNIYNTSVTLQQPECQILWAIYSQKYLNKIKLIDFHNVINPVWKEPFTSVIYKKDDLQNTHFKFFIIFFIIFIIFYLYNKTKINII